MSGYPVVTTAKPRYRVTPNIAGTPIPKFSVAASRSGTTAVGTMDSSPTEAEVLALQQQVEFASADNVREVVITFASGKPASCAALCLLARVNGNDLPENTLTFANGFDSVITILPNEPTKIVSDVAITKLSLVAVPSGITSANYEGAAVYMQGASYG